MRFAFLMAALACRGADAPSSLAAKIDALIDKSPIAARASLGIHVVDTKTGKTVYERNADHLFLPASNLKLFTAALALEKLGPDRRFVTKLVRTANGDLVLVGSGDPSMSGRAYPYSKTAVVGNPLGVIEDLADQAVAAGLTHVDGDIVGDDQLYPWAPYAPGWTEDDAVQVDGAPVSALTLNDNRVSITIQPGAVAGDLATLTLDPPLEYYAIDNRVSTVAGAGDGRVRLSRAAGSRQLLLWGSIGARSSGTKVTISMDDPALYAARALYDALTRRGIAVRGQPVARHRAASDDVLPAEGDVLASRTSPPLSDLLQVMEKVSQNLHAELMLREVGREVKGSGTREAGLEALAAMLTSIGTKPEEWRVEDGSGLSNTDVVTPRAVTRLLTHMLDSKYSDTWLSLLPVGGQDGTLGDRLCCVSDSFEVRAKTGSLARASTLSGYAESKSRGKLAFSILVNNFTVQPAEVRAWIDKIVLTLVN